MRKRERKKKYLGKLFPDARKEACSKREKVRFLGNEIAGCGGRGWGDEEGEGVMVMMRGKWL